MSFREEVMSHETIWAYMYGYPVYNSIIQTKEEQIIEIKTQKLRKDYGQTWAYTKEELLK